MGQQYSNLAHNDGDCLLNAISLNDTEAAHDWLSI